MRVSKHVAAENRQRIIQTAARLFRERGLSNIGVDELAGAAGLSSGSLYNYFGSKDGLTVEAVDEAFADFARRMRGKQDLADYVAAYLSPDHRDDRGSACAVATLGCEVSGQSKAVRASFTQGIKQLVARMKVRLSPERPEGAGDDAAWMMMATMIGSMILARAIDDPLLSNQILAMGRVQVLQANSGAARG
jgi:TetR/AcrR family transcriptional repressor of nem operon